MIENIIGKGIRDRRLSEEFERVAPETKRTGEELLNFKGKSWLTILSIVFLFNMIFSWLRGGDNNSKRPIRPREKYYDRPMNDRVRERRNMNNNRYRQ